MKRFVIAGVLLALIACGALIAWKYYRWIYAPNTQTGTTSVLLIHEGTSASGVLEALSEGDMVVNARSLRWVATRMKYGDQSVKSGRYVISAELSNYDLLHKLRLGAQDPVALTIHAAHSAEEVAGTIGRQLQTDSLSFLRYLRDTFLPQSEYNEATLLCMFIPNTYEVWWNVSPARLVERLQTEHKRFWDESRRAKAAAISMTPTEVYTLASIVERETQVADERRTIAGVYLNRLRRGIPLQADPTVVFALGDPTIRRVLHRHLELDSPYNTYRYAGLPPGPIAMPAVQCIDAVLDAEQHDYLYFCAYPGYEGRHAFATTLNAHMVNARRYQAWLDAEGIR